MQEDVPVNPEAAAAIIDTTFKPPPRPPIPVTVWVISGVALIAMGFLGFQVYQTFTYHDIPFGQAIMPAKEDWPDTRPAALPATPIRPAPETGITATDSRNSSREIAPVAPISTADVLSTAESRPDPQREIRLPAIPCTPEAAASGKCIRDVKPGNTRDTPARTTTVATARPPSVISKPPVKSPAASGSCSAGVWALGLCTTEPVQPKESP